VRVARFPKDFTRLSAGTIQANAAVRVAMKTQTRIQEPLRSSADPLRAARVVAARVEDGAAASIDGRPRRGRLQPLALPALFVLGLAGCASVEYNRRASVLDYLYPNKDTPRETPTVPRLELPMDVGIAFVPEPSPTALASAFTESAKLHLMNEIANHFREHRFVRCIELIPTQYLRPGGGFENLDQLHTMFGTDVIVLLSYNQAQFTDQGLLSITYWTLVGAYVVEGQRNETATMMDAAVYHVPSRKLLFRAPGISQVRRSSTPVNLSEELRLDSGAGFRRAATNLVVNLDTQLDLFRERVKHAPDEYHVVERPGSTGIGKLDARWLFVLALIGGVLLCPKAHGKR
jgi:rhombotail lipoprotein